MTHTSIDFRAAQESRDPRRDMFRRITKRGMGITLIEMMVVVAILAILVALAAPNLSELFIRNRLETAANELVTALNFARSEAMRRGLPVSMRRASAVDKEWTEGWEIFVDINEDGSKDDNEELIRVGQPVTSPLTLRSSDALKTYVPFAADGRIEFKNNLVLADELQPLAAPGVFVLCHGKNLLDAGRSRSRAVVVVSSGRTRLGADTNANGIPENAAGSDIKSCSPS